MKLPFDLRDYERAEEEEGVNCGPSALAAILPETLERALALLPDFKKGGGVKQVMMEQALDLAGRRWWPYGVECPPYGLAIVRIDGPWPQHKAPGHWIGTASVDGGKYVFDSWAIDRGGWLPVEAWGTAIFPKLAASEHGATGKCWISYGIEVAAKRE